MGGSCDGWVMEGWVGHTQRSGGRVMLKGRRGVRGHPPAEVTSLCGLNVAVMGGLCSKARGRNDDHSGQQGPWVVASGQMIKDQGDA